MLKSGVGRWGVRVLASCLLLVAGCGQFFPPNTGSGGSGSGGSGGGASSGFFYAANVNSSLDTVAAYSYNGTSLSALSGSPYQMSLEPDVMAITPDNKYLYVGSNQGGLFAFNIASDGTLTNANGGTAVDDSDLPAEIAIDPTGKYLLMVQLGANNTLLVSSFAIDDSTGTLTVVQNSTLTFQGATGGFNSGLAFVPNTSFVYLAEGSGGVDGMNLNTSTGVLTALSVHQDLLPGGSADTSATSDPSGQYLFVGETGTNGVRAFTVNASTGVLTSIGTTTVGSGPNALLVDATGAYLYVALYGSAQVAAYTIGSTGTLAEIAGSPYTTGTLPASLAEDSTGSYLMVGAQGGSPDVQLFSIASATATTPGALASVTTASTGGGVSPAEVSTVVATH